MDGKGAVFMAVFKGKLAEGIDFPDALCRMVFIVGIPYPPLYEPIVVEKRSY
jgi:regulator of telomere elongation helicase 1